MSRFEQIIEDPRITAYRSMSMVIAHPRIEQLKAFLRTHGYNIEDVSLAIRVLKNNRVVAAHIRAVIDRLFPSTSDQKRSIALKALRVLELLAEEFKEPLFLKTD